MLEIALQHPCPTLKRRLKPVRRMSVWQLTRAGTLGPFLKKLFFGKARITSQRGCGFWVHPEMKINHSNCWQPRMETMCGCTHQQAFFISSESRYFEPLAGRPVLMTSRRRTAASSAVSLNFARLATAARRISLFFAEIPASRQRFLSTAICAYSGSGMVKLSRTSLAFFALAGLPSLPFLTTKGAGSWTTFFIGADFMATGRVTGFFAGGVTALATAGALFLAGFAATGAAGLTGRGRGAGLGTGDEALTAAAGVVTGAADSVVAGLLVSSIMVNPLSRINRINSICS